MVGNKSFIKSINDFKDEYINFDTLYLILKNQTIWPIKIMQIKDSLKGHFLFLGY